jgi:hypothetical protein
MAGPSGRSLDTPLHVCQNFGFVRKVYLKKINEYGLHLFDKLLGIIKKVKFDMINKELFEKIG